MTTPAPKKRILPQASPEEPRPNQRLVRSAIYALVIAAFVFLLWQQTAPPPSRPAAEIPDPALGQAAAPIEIVTYGDFACPACRSWQSAGVVAQLTETYGERVRFVWKDFPIITPYSPKAAEAGHCAASQGKFWEYHHYLYASTTNFSDDGLKAAAAAIGLNQTAFDACLDSGEMAGKVRANESEARRLGFRGTPGFTFNGQPLPAPPTFAQLAQLIDRQLSTQ